MSLQDVMDLGKAPASLPALLNEENRVGFFSVIDQTSSFFNQWEFQDPKLEVPTIYKAYVRPM